MIDYCLFITLTVSKLIYFIKVRLLLNHSLTYSFTIPTEGKTAKLPNFTFFLT